MTTQSPSEAPCAGGEPPVCCQRPLEMMLGLGESESTPCPACGSRVTMLTMLAPGEWQCWEPDCAAIWMADR